MIDAVCIEQNHFFTFCYCWRTEELDIFVFCLNIIYLYLFEIYLLSVGTKKAERLFSHVSCSVIFIFYINGSSSIT